jgi:hypothetical protein
VVGDGRYTRGAYSVNFVSPDLVEEVRLVTASVDAESLRGAGQLQMVTRSGTNQFRGSLFWNNRNSALDAAEWFNNFNGVKKNYENRTQAGGRIGGPIVKNKTFFFALIDTQRDIVRETFVGTVLTAQARQGIFRFFPGVDNQNINQNNPTVDRNGNPVRPSNATGDLQSFSVFGPDSSRPRFDTTGFVQNTLLSRMPLPNDFTVGDGLNTAGIRFTRRINGQDDGAGSNIEENNRNQFNTRLDHNFNSNHKLSFVYTYESTWNMTAQAGIMNWPNGYNGAVKRFPSHLAFSLVSSFSTNLVNELRVGRRNSLLDNWAPWYVGRHGEGEVTDPVAKEAFKLLPVNNGIPFQPVTTLFPSNILNWNAGDGGTRGAESPLWSYGDTLAWTQGKHAFKVGAEYRYMRSAPWNDSNFTPQAVFGAGGVAVTGIDNGAFPGLSGNNATTARNLLIDLSGSVASIRQGFDLRSPTDLVFRGYGDGVKLKYRDWRGTEFSSFFKDNWKVLPALTLNLGVNWSYFGVPYEGNGLSAEPVGGEVGLCGISCGPITTMQLVGKHSSHPDIQRYQDDWNNLAPSVGLSWSLPWFGQNKTVLRAGYGINYTGDAALGSVSTNPGTFEGSGTTGISFTSPAYLSLSNVALPIPHQFEPLRPSPLDGSRAESIMTFANKRSTAYIQNFTIELQRQIAGDWTLNAAYVGSKATKLYGGLPLNSVNIRNNGILEAFNITRRGGDAPLFDQMLKGLNLGSGVINGTTITGSASLRANTNTRGFIANNNVGGLADFLNRSTNVTGQGGGFIRNSGLFPENFIVLNPQFNGVTLNSNPSNSTYHSLQLEVTKRLSYGVSSSASYTWSRTLGENDGNGNFDARDPQNRRLDKTLLGFHRTHSIAGNGTFELPFGPNRAFLSHAPAVVQRLVERWQWGGLINWSSGVPLTITAPISSLTQSTGNSTPNIVGDFPKSMGTVTRVANGVVYFNELRQVPDPARATVTTLQSTQGSFTNLAITDSQGNLLLVNPDAGQIGNMGLKWIEGPSRISLDMNLIKRVRIAETKEFELRVDAVNVLNHPNFGSPTLNINSLNFGRITSATGNRRFTANLRFNF